MAKHVIIGAGVGGLYIANRLINRGVDPSSIVIIEKRKENNYTRPGRLDRDSFDLVGKNLNMPTPHSPALHIKELERLMYNNLPRQKVVFVNEEFIGFQGKTVITRKLDNSQGVYPADYVFDCSGTKSVVAQAVNQYQQSVNSTAVFATRTLVDVNPIQDHLIAHVRVCTIEKINSFMALKGEVIPFYLEHATVEQKIQFRERLVSLGWTYEAFPTLFHFHGGVKNKVSLYMETPPDLDVAKQADWIRLLLNMYSNDWIHDFQTLKPSTKYAEKTRVVGFKSIPYVMNKVVHESDNLPTIILGFDALKGFDYRLGVGVVSGVECIEFVMSHSTVSDGSISAIDQASIEKLTFKYINGTYLSDLKKRLTTRQKSIDNALNYYREIYENAVETLFTCTNNIRLAYLSLAIQLAFRYVHVHSCHHSHMQVANLDKIIALNNCFRILLLAKTIVQDSNIIDRKDIISNLEYVFDILSLVIRTLDQKEFLTENIYNIKVLDQLLEDVEKNFESIGGVNENQVIGKVTMTVLRQLKSQVKEIINNQSQQFVFNQNIYGMFATQNLQNNSRKEALFPSNDNASTPNC